MELKLPCGSVFALFKGLLIVPYGIETAEGSVTTAQGYYLLIVPYGIETEYTEAKKALADNF